MRQNAPALQNAFSTMLEAEGTSNQARDGRVDSMQEGLILEENKEQTKMLEVSDGSYIEFYKNGTLLERKFMDIYEGTYHAAVSLYMQGRCRVNFGKCPFAYPPRRSAASSGEMSPDKAAGQESNSKSAA